MDAFLIRIYKEQILDQVEDVEVAYAAVESSKADTDSLFRNVHYFLIHVSNIIKLIQPKISGDLDFKNYRAKQLKRNFPKLPSLDPKKISIRDDFEHFDERVDSWVINSEKHNYADKNIGDISSIKGWDPKDNFRWYDPKNKKLYFAGQDYSLEELYFYVQKVKNALQ